MRHALLLPLLLACGCLTPRSAVLAQTAAPLGPGAKEVGLAIGIAHQTQASPPFGVTDESGRNLTAQTLARGFSLPAFEANGHFGITDTIGFNLHASPAGIQPGMKITLLRRRVFLALMPEGAVGYGSSYVANQVTLANGRLSEDDPRLTTSFHLLGRMRLLMSHRSGAYGGVAYDLQFQHLFMGSTTPGGTPESLRTNSLQHSLGAAFGFEIAIDRAILRPELAVVWTFGLSRTTTNQAGTVVAAGPGGQGLLVLPTVTIAVGSNPDAVDAGAAEDEERLDTGSPDPSASESEE